MKSCPKKARKPSTLFRVYIEQVNQTYVDVWADDPDAAQEKAYRKWRKEDAHSRILACELQKSILR